ncbi:MAG TPA: LCP family protein [Anaerolineales bacterium]|nr:LCP family protein [Anaerolineales bacterium]
MTRPQKAILSFLFVLACALFGLAFWLYAGRWQQPLGPALQIPTVTPFQMPATWTPDPAMTSTLPSTSQLVPVEQAAFTPTLALNNVAGLCGAPPVMNILVVGSDARSNSYLYGLADVIRLVRVDFINPKITILEFPRDLWVEIPDIADNLNGQHHERLNQAYLYGNPGFGYTDDPAEGPGLLARTMTLNFGTEIDHYAAINMQTFVKMVDAVGGIDVYLPTAVDGRTAEDTNKRLLFNSGTHHLNGTQALTLARIRIEGVFERAENQNRVLCALRDQLTSPYVIPKIPDLIRSFQGAVQTDLSPQQLGQLACLGTQIRPENILFASFPQEHFKPVRQYDPVFKGRVFIWDVDFNILRDFVVRFQQGTWPAAIGPVQASEEEGAAFCP